MTETLVMSSNPLPFLWIVKAFNIVKSIRFGRVHCWTLHPVCAFSLENAKESLAIEWKNGPLLLYCE